MNLDVNCNGQSSYPSHNINFLMKILILRPSLTPFPIEVHRYDPVSSISSFFIDETKRKPIFSFNGTVLLESMSFGYYDITEGSSINLSYSDNTFDSSAVYKTNHPQNLQKIMQSRKFYIDQSRPLQFHFDDSVPLDLQQKVIHHVSQNLMPERYRLLAQIADNRTAILENQILNKRHFYAPSVKESVETSSVPTQSTVIIPASAPCDSELPKCWSDQPEPSNFVLGNTFVSIPLISATK